MDINKPWKVMLNGCCIKEYKMKHAAIKYAKMKKEHSPSDVHIWIICPIEYIEI